MYRVRTVATGVAGSPWYVNLHFSEEGTAQVAADKTRAFFGSLASRLSNAVTYQVASEVGIVNEATGVLEDVTPVDTDPLTGGGVGLAPPANQGLVRLNTATIRNGRRVQGRIFVPGIALSVVGTNGLPTTPFLDNLQTAANVLAESATSPRLVVYSPPIELLGTIVTPGQASEVTGALARNMFAVLRSRRD